MHYAHKLYHGLLSWIFPIKCLSCGTKGSYLCENCLAKSKKAEPVEEPWITALFSYQDETIRKAIWALKYKGRYPIALCFGTLLSDAGMALLEDTLIIGGERKEILIVPIPSSTSGKRKRGYNQSEFLAKALSDRVGFKATLVKDTLRKIRNTPRQSEIKKRKERIENIAGAFSARSDIVSGRVVLLVDDVTTTGATLREARRAILVAGGKNIYAVTVAH